MTDETKPSKVHKIATAVAAGISKTAHVAKAVVSPVVSLAGKLPIVSQVKTAIVGSARTWEIAAFWLLCVIAAYAWGHQEEAKKYTQVFARLSACVGNLNEVKAVKLPVCATPAATPPPPVVVAPPPPPPEPKAPAPRRAKKAASGAWWQF